MTARAQNTLRRFVGGKEICEQKYQKRVAQVMLICFLLVLITKFTFFFVWSMWFVVGHGVVFGEMEWTESAVSLLF